jgi:hypothetical protein
MKGISEGVSLALDIEAGEAERGISQDRTHRF